MPNDRDSEADVRGLLKSLAYQFDTDLVKVDQKTSNASRITKVPGTWARKGSNTTERPHRRAKVLFEVRQ